MWNDPIVEEVHRIRAEIDARFPDLKSYVAWLRQEESKHPERLKSYEQIHGHPFVLPAGMPNVSGETTAAT